MSKWKQKLEKVAAPDLESGETLVEGVFLQPAGTTVKMIGQGVGGVVGRALASKMGGGTTTELVTDSGIAATMPDAATVLGLTNRRLLVYGHSSLSGKPKGLVLAMPTTDVVGVEIEKQKATYRFVIAFADGTGSSYEAPRMSNDPEAFVAAIDAR